MLQEDTKLLCITETYKTYGATIIDVKGYIVAKCGCESEARQLVHAWNNRNKG